MADFIIKKNKNYTVMSNYHLRDRNLSLKAKGLLSFMLSLPDDWDYSVNGLVAICKESKDAIKTTIDELKKNGYLEIIKERGDKGYYKYNYVISEIPKSLEIQQSHPDMENPPLDHPPLEEPELDNQLQINTNNKIDKIDKKDKTEILKNPFIIDLIKTGYIKKDEYNLEFYDDFFERLKQKGYSLSDINIKLHYVLKRCKERKFKDEKGDDIKDKFSYLTSSIVSNIKREQRLEELSEDEIFNPDDFDDLINSVVSNKRTHDLNR